MNGLSVSNYMKLNQDKCHLLILGHKYESVLANIGSCKFWESIDQKLIIVNIDCNLNLSHYFLKQCNENALTTVYNDSASTFEKLLEEDNSVTIHVRNLRILATELNKIK